MHSRSYAKLSAIDGKGNPPLTDTVAKRGTSSATGTFAYNFSATSITSTITTNTVEAWPCLVQKSEGI
jgi:hypothetical protein